MKKKIYIFGNPLLPFDNLPLKLTPELKKQFPEIDFIIIDPNENLKSENKELIIIDTIVDIGKVTVFKDLNRIKTEKIYSAHDLDLAFNLKILEKIGELKKVTIFGIPQNIEKSEVLKQLTDSIKEYLKVKPN